MDAPFAPCSEDKQPRYASKQTIDQRNSIIVSPEERILMGETGEASRQVDHALSVGPEILNALQPPSEDRFKQLVSLHLLRATFQQEEQRDENKLSVERMLQSARRQNSAEKIRLGLMQQQISAKLRIVEAQERRMGELLSHLQKLTSQPTALSTQEETVLQLIRDMNDIRAGNPRDWPPFMDEMMSYGQGGGSLKKGTPLRFVSQICEAFMKGYGASCHLQLDLPLFKGRTISLEEMASYNSDIMFLILGSIHEAIKSQLQHVGSSDPQQAAQALDQIQKIAEESVVCQCCFIVGQPSDFAARNLWFRKTSMTSVPHYLMQTALDHARLREEQLIEIQALWQQHRSTMASLEEGEQLLRAKLRGQLKQASGLLDCQELYLPIMDTVAELEANWRAHTNCAFRWEFSVTAKVIDPLQVATLMAFLGPYPFRPSLMVAAGLLQPASAPS